MMMGSGLSMLALGWRSRRMPEAERNVFLLSVLPVSKLASYGLLVLITSGILLAVPQWPALKSDGLFHAKLLFVFIAALLLGVNQMFHAKAKRAAGHAPSETQALKKVMLSGRLLTLTGLVIVVLAVLVFE